MMKILLFFFIPFLVFGDIPKVNDPTIYDGIIDTFQSSAKHWQPIFTQTALYIFYVLAAVQLAWEFGTMAARGEFEFGGVASALIRTIVIFGIFKFLLMSPDIFISWFNSFNELAARANNNAGVHSANLFASAGTLFKISIENFSILDLGDSMALLLIAILAGILLVLISVELLTTILKFYFSLYLNIIILGFAPLTATRQWPINGITNMIKIGMEVLMLKLIVGLSVSTISNYTLAIKENNDNDSLIYLFILVISLFSLAKMVHGMVEGFFNGYAVQNNNAGVQMAKAMASGAVGASLASINNSTNTSNSKSSQTSTNNNSSSINPMLPKNDTNSNNANNTSTASTVVKAVASGVAGGLGGAMRASFDLAPKQYTNGYREAVQDSTEASNKSKFNTEYKLGDKND